MNFLNYSITMNGIRSCSHGCSYCSIATTVNYTQGVNKNDLINSLIKLDEKIYNTEFRADFNKLEETFLHNSRFEDALERQKKGENTEVHIDLWGGDPVTNHLCTVEIVEFLRDFFVNKHGMKLTISSSTGGLPLARNDVKDWYIENKISLQLSHDGIGQWIRTGDLDPLYDDRIHDNIAELFNCGTLGMVNDCLNFYNNDVFDNKKYWDDYFASIGMKREVRNKLFIKLNRCYDGIYDMQALNKRGRWRRETYKELVNRPLGDVRHHNWKNLNSGNLELDHLFAHELDDYLHDWYKIMLIMNDPVAYNSDEWAPYRNYLSEQIRRWQWMNSRADSSGRCRAYQRAMGGLPHKLSKNKYGEYEMFVIDTTGRYCECNLTDADTHVKNVGCSIEPEKCKYCKYYLQSECMGCGSEIFTDDCEWRYRWVQLLEINSMLQESMRHNINRAVGLEKKRIIDTIMAPSMTNNKGCK